MSFFCIFAFQTFPANFRRFGIGSRDRIALTELKNDVELEMKKRKVLTGGDAARQNLKLLQKQYTMMLNMVMETGKVKKRKIVSVN